MTPTRTDASGYKEIFPLIMEDKLRLGATGNGTDMVFGVPEGAVVAESDRARAAKMGITKSWFGGASKLYPRQIQVDRNGRRSEVTKLNDGPVLGLPGPTPGETYYEVGGKCYTQVYARILIRRKA